MMLLYATVTAVVLLAAFAANILKSMRDIDRYSLVSRFIMKTGIFSLATKLQIRSQVVEITASNGVKAVLPHYGVSITIGTVLKFDVRHDDVFVVTYPKAGTTWMQEIAWLICNNADIEAAKKEVVMNRYGFLEVLDVGNEHWKGLQALERWPRRKRRMIKTHLPYRLLPEYVQSGRKCKLIYVARNPKDTCVSYYHFNRMNRTMPAPGTWNDFFADFCSGRTGYGLWFNHTLEYWKKYQKNKQQIYFVTYESLKKNLRAELVPLAKFLNRDLSEQQLDAIAEHCTFESMSKNKCTNYSTLQKLGLDFKAAKFMRKGEVGDWRNHFTLNQNEAFDALYEVKMKGSELKSKIQFDI